MSANWRDHEIRQLLSIRADGEIVRQIHGTARDSIVYDQITKRLRDRGVIRTKAQVNNKLKALKRQYQEIIRDHSGRVGNHRETWCYFKLCEAVWGSGHSTDPVAAVGTMETASTPINPPDAMETPPTSIKSGEPGVDKVVPPLLEELGWLSRAVKNEEVDNEFDLEDNSPAEPSVSGPSSAEMTSSGSFSPLAVSSPHLDPSSSPLPLLTPATTQSVTHPGLLFPVSHHTTHPSPSTSPCTPARKKRRSSDDVILERLVRMEEEERQKLRQRDNADSRFAAVIVDMLAKVNPQRKEDVKFKIYQMLFEAGKDLSQQS
ncbi:uncharacterized protein ABDE67_022821 [Symphorus nematophorus]